MKREVQLALLDRIEAHLATGVSSTDLGEDIHCTDAAVYTDPARFAVEREALFLGGPVVACLRGDVAAPGDYLTVVLVGVPLLIARGADGRLRAFRNVCRHRGTCVAAGRGNAAVFSCPYHGWTYRLDGSLVRATHAEGFAGLDRDRFALEEIACGEAGGVVLVQLDAPPGALDAVGWLAGLADEFDAYGLGGYVPVKSRARTWAMNWKFMVDSFGEIYHVRHLHKDSIAPLIRSEPALFDAFGPHSRQVSVRWSISEVVGRDRDDLDLLAHTTLAYQLLPNTVMLYQQDHVELYQIFPEGLDRSTAVTTVYAPTAPDERARRRWSKALDLLLAVIGGEDFRLFEQIQSNAASGALRQIVFGRNEPALSHSHRSIEALLARRAGPL